MSKNAINTSPLFLFLLSSLPLWSWLPVTYSVPIQNMKLKLDACYLLITYSKYSGSQLYILNREQVAGYLFPVPYSKCEAGYLFPVPYSLPIQNVKLATCSLVVTYSKCEAGYLLPIQNLKFAACYLFVSYSKYKVYYMFPEVRCLLPIHYLFKIWSWLPVTYSLPIQNM